MIKNNDATLNELIEFLNNQPGSRPKVIAESLGVSRQYVQKLLANNKDIFNVTGSGPNRFYRNADKDNHQNQHTNYNHSIKLENELDTELINKHFYSLTPLGEELIGIEGFNKWCIARNYNIRKKQEEYLSILHKYYPKEFKSPINFSSKLQNTFDDFSLNKVWAVDYYNFEIFGKTKLGTQVMIAKQTGDERTTQILINKISSSLDHIIKSYHIEAIAFVSPTIQRQSQLMSKLENSVALNIPRIKVHKVGARILIAQKTLKSLEDRVLNAAQTFIIESSDHYKNVLIIDDALGSGATLNEIAKQIKQKKVAIDCYGLVLVSSPSGYEVINEV